MSVDSAGGPSPCLSSFGGLFMFRSPWRRSAVVLTSLLVLAAPLMQPLAARAATATSSVAVQDPTGDTVLNGGPTHADAPKADITAASVRYQNDFVTFGYELACRGKA